MFNNTYLGELKNSDTVQYVGVPFSGGRYKTRTFSLKWRVLA